MDLVNIALLQLVVSALPAKKVPHQHGGEDAETGSRAPVDDGVSEEEILDDCGWLLSVVTLA